MDIEQAQEFARLTALEREYRVTIKVLAVLTERFLQATGGDRLELASSALVDSPDLVAWRDTDGGNVVITVAR